jgi:hypothetical protein
MTQTRTRRKRTRRRTQTRKKRRTRTVSTRQRMIRQNRRCGGDGMRKRRRRRFDNRLQLQYCSNDFFANRYIVPPTNGDLILPSDCWGS